MSRKSILHVSNALPLKVFRFTINLYFVYKYRVRVRAGQNFECTECGTSRYFMMNVVLYAMYIYVESIISTLYFYDKVFAQERRKGQKKCLNRKSGPF